MPETARTLDPGFSTADAECPRFGLREGVLTVEFMNWSDQAIIVQFTDVAGVKWQQIEPSAAPGDPAAGLGKPRHRNDEVCEIIQSAWVEAYRAAGETVDGLRHFRLCFNAWGVLDVLAASMQAQKPQGASLG